MSEKRSASWIVGLSIATLVAIVILLAFLMGSLRWLDKTLWTTYVSERWITKALPYFYLKTPFSSHEDNVRRTIKLAHFMALSKIEEKSLETTLLDFYEAQKLIENFVNRKADKLDSVDASELILERLTLLNRMNAVILQSDKYTPVEIESVKRIAMILLPTLSDHETKRTLEKELRLFDFDWQKINIKNENLTGEMSNLIDLYHYGLARCVSGDEAGAALITSALNAIPRTMLIDITMRNIDHPLVAAAGMHRDSACTVAVDLIQIKLKG